jgi:hypothetical protein
MGNNQKYDRFFHKKDTDKNVSENPIAVGLVMIYFKKETWNKCIEKHGYFDDASEQNSDSDSDSDDASEQNSDDDTDYDDDTDDDTDDDCLQNLSVGGNIRTDVHEIMNFAERETLRDFGKASYYEFDALMKMFDNKLIDVHYYDPLVIQENLNQLASMEKQITRRPQELHSELENYKQKIVKFADQHLKTVGFIPYKLFKSDIIVHHRDPDYLKRYDQKIQEIIQPIKKIVAEADGDDMLSIEKSFRKVFPHKNDWIDRDIDGNMANLRNCQHMIPTY